MTISKKHLRHAVMVSTLLLSSAFAAGASAQSKHLETLGTELKTHPPGPADSGIWKAVIPPVEMKGEFADYDPIGLAAGKKIKADCSINWTNPDTQKLYCFSSATSLVYFLTAPHHNIARAQKAWFTGS